MFAMRSIACRAAASSIVGAPAALKTSQRAFAAAAIKKVAILQDQQIPKENAISILQDKGFDVAWSIAEPSDAEAIVTVTSPVTAEVLDKHPACKLVAVSFTGFNHVDLEACRKRGIAVVNVPAYSTDSVAELSVGLTLAVYREIPGGERTIRAGNWVHSKGGMEIRDKVVGIVGLGDIGIRTAELYRAFGPKELLGWSRREKAAFSSAPISGKHVGLEELFDRSDIVSVHVALNAETKGFIGRSLMERLRPDSVLVNVARGGVMDQKALADLLCQRRFRAGLDVFEPEPIPAEDPILKVPEDQAVMTPHVAYKTVEALARRMVITATNIRAYADGKPQNQVA
jgi:D-3-phosphoglycerate dehydrogenase